MSLSTDDIVALNNTGRFAAGVAAAMGQLFESESQVDVVIMDSLLFGMWSSLNMSQLLLLVADGTCADTFTCQVYNGSVIAGAKQIYVDRSYAYSSKERMRALSVVDTVEAAVLEADPDADVTSETTALGAHVQAPRLVSPVALDLISHATLEFLRLS